MKSVNWAGFYYFGWTEKERWRGAKTLAQEVSTNSDNKWLLKRTGHSQKEEDVPEGMGGRNAAPRWARARDNRHVIPGSGWPKDARRMAGWVNAKSFSRSQPMPKNVGHFPAAVNLVSVTCRPANHTTSRCPIIEGTLWFKGITHWISLCSSQLPLPLVSHVNTAFYCLMRSI